MTLYDSFFLNLFKQFVYWLLASSGVAIKRYLNKCPKTNFVKKVAELFTSIKSKFKYDSSLCQKSDAILVVTREL